MEPATTGLGQRPRIVLVGAGHAHLHVIRHRQRLTNAEVTLVDPGGFWYSGMAAGVLGGRLPPADDRLDPQRLARRHGVEARRDRMVGLDRENRCIQLDHGAPQPFTLLSLNLGSRVSVMPRCTPGPAVWAVKPIPKLIQLRRRLEAEFRRGQIPRLAVVGGGASGVEIACNLRCLTRRHRVDAPITLITRRGQLLEGAPHSAIRWLRRHLERMAIRVLTETRAMGHARDGLLIAREDTPSGEDSLSLLEAEHVVHATGLTPPKVADTLGLPMIPGRGLAVQETLQSPLDPDIFAVGDCAAMIDHALPRLGVYGVRQAPVLLNNLAARLASRALQCYLPQRQALAILDVGQGMGLAIRGRLWWAGRLSLAWKGKLDRSFLRQFRD